MTTEATPIEDFLAWMCSEQCMTNWTGFDHKSVADRLLNEYTEQKRMPRLEQRMTWQVMGAEFKRLGDLPTDGTWAVMEIHEQSPYGGFVRLTEARVAWGTGAHNLYVIAIPIEKLERKP